MYEEIERHEMVEVDYLDEAPLNYGEVNIYDYYNVILKL